MLGYEHQFVLLGEARVAEGREHLRRAVVGAMKTEHWEMEYEFERPARVDTMLVENGRRPIIVHLDQWCWDHLLRDRAGEPCDPSEAGVYAFLKERALSGEVVFPLSQTHYRENLVRENLDARWDTAVVMAELSGFTTFSAHDLAVWEARAAVVAYLDLRVETPKPNPFGWGIAHCFLGIESRACILDTWTGRRADLSQLSDDAEAIAQLEESVAYRSEIAMLAGREPRLESHSGLLPLDPVPDERGTEFELQELRLAAVLAREGATQEQMRDWIGFLAFHDSENHVVTACEQLGLSPNAIHDDITRRMHVGDKGGIDAFLQCMPIQGLFTELRVRAHAKGNFRFKSSDLADFLAVATVAPFVDDMVVDETTFNLLTEAPLPSGVARPLRRLSDLRMSLEERLRT